MSLVPRVGRRNQTWQLLMLGRTRISYKRKKGKGRMLIEHYLHSKSPRPAALYNLGSGSWLARANGAAAQIAAIQCTR